MPAPPPAPFLPNAFRQNPFGRTSWYVNPTLAANLDRTIGRSAARADVLNTLRQMRRVPSAFWIDSKQKIRGGRSSLEGVLADAAASGSSPPLCVFVFYDLPNRDCNAKASNGEIRFSAHDADAALEEYKREYVDPFVEVRLPACATSMVTVARSYVTCMRLYSLRCARAGPRAVFKRACRADPGA